MFVTGTAARSPAPGSERTPDSVSGRNRQASGSPEGTRDHWSIPPIQRAAMRETGDGPWCIRTAQVLTVSLTIPSLRMKKLRLREAAVLARKWQGRNVNPGEPNVKLSVPSTPLQMCGEDRPLSGMGVSFFLRLGPVGCEAGRAHVGVAGNAPRHLQGSSDLPKTPGQRRPSPSSFYPRHVQTSCLCPQRLRPCRLMVSVASAQISPQPDSQRASLCACVRVNDRGRRRVRGE